MEECLEDWRAERERLLAEAAEADAASTDEAEDPADEGAASLSFRVVGGRGGKHGGLHE